MRRKNEHKEKGKKGTDIERTFPLPSPQSPLPRFAERVMLVKQRARLRIKSTTTTEHPPPPPRNMGDGDLGVLCDAESLSAGSRGWSEPPVGSTARRLTFDTHATLSAARRPSPDVVDDIVDTSFYTESLALIDTAILEDFLSRHGGAASSAEPAVVEGVGQCLAAKAAAKAAAGVPQAPSFPRPSSSSPAAQAPSQLAHAAPVPSPPATPVPVRSGRADSRESDDSMCMKTPSLPVAGEVHDG